MGKGVIKGIGVALVVLGLVSVGMAALVAPSHGLEGAARVLDPKGQEIGVMVNGQFRPHPGAVQSVMLVPCSPAIDHGPIWAFCRDGFYFSNVFAYRKYVSAKRSLAHYTGPVVIEVSGRQNQSFLKDGWLQ